MSGIRIRSARYASIECDSNDSKCVRTEALEAGNKPVYTPMLDQLAQSIGLLCFRKVDQGVCVLCACTCACVCTCVGGGGEGVW